MIKPALIIKSTIRKIPRSFSWIDHRFVNEGFMGSLTRGAILLYFFLTAVGNRNGLSFYGEEKLSKLLKMGMTELLSSRSELIRKDLIAYRAPVYQVLSLPKKPGNPGEKRIGVETDDLPEGFIRKIEEEVKEELRHHFGDWDFPDSVLRNRMQMKIDEYLSLKKVLGGKKKHVGGVMIDKQIVFEIHRLFHHQGWSKSRVASHLRLSRETVKRYLVDPLPRRGERKKRKSKLDPWKQEIRDILKKEDAVSAQVIFQHLRKKVHSGVMVGCGLGGMV